MNSLRTVSFKARTLNHTHCLKVCRTFGTQLALRAQGQSSSASDEILPQSQNAASNNTPKPQARNATDEDSVAARRRRTTDSLSAFINQMMPMDRDIARPSRKSAGFDPSESLSDRDGLDSSNPISRKQGDILRGVTRGRQFAESFQSSRGVGKLPPLAPPVRLDAYIARAEAVSGGTSLARAIDKLNIKLAQNSVKADIRRQKFHERGGLKRKRLRRERWRRRFKEGFVATVKKVQRMKAQGW